jgi:hypothetical protein
LAIPETFTEAQAELILSLAQVNETDSRTSAERLLQDWTPERFTEAQAACIRELLALEARELQATLIDAMEPCELRLRLLAARAPTGL